MTTDLSSKWKGIKHRLQQLKIQVQQTENVLAFSFIEVRTQNSCIYSEPCRNPNFLGANFCVLNSVLFVLVKLTTNSYIKTLFVVWLLQDSVLLRVWFRQVLLFYTVFKMLDFNAKYDMYYCELTPTRTIIFSSKGWICFFFIIEAGVITCMKI